MRKGFQIAIDGPVAAGKSTVAARLAERLGLVYVDTGAMYRAVALRARNIGVSWEDERGLEEVVAEIDLELARPKKNEVDGRMVTVKLEGEDVSRLIREPVIGEGASVVAQYKKVRQELVRRQQEIAKNKDVVMEGRDIAVRVLPQADLKIYLDARLSERVERKQQQLKQQGRRLSKKEVEKDIETRDTREMTREIDPLRPAEGAWVFDTTGLSIREVVDKISGRVEKMRGVGL